MRFVERAVVSPARCAVLPHLPEGGNHARGFIDTGSEMLPSAREQHVYVSVVAVEEMAKLLKWHSPESVDAIERELEGYKHKVAALEDEVAELNRDFDAIEVLQSRGYTARKKPGRKPNAVKEA